MGITESGAFAEVCVVDQGSAWLDQISRWTEMAISMAEVFEEE